MSERTWAAINLLGAVVAIIGTATSAWRDVQEARHARIRAQFDALDLRQRQQPQQPAEREPKWVDL